MAQARNTGLHVVFTAECNNPQFDWFAVGLFESFRTSGIHGNITRLLACDQQDLKRYKGLNIGPTFVHPNYWHNPINGDTSKSYNKPASVMHFTREAHFEEQFILFIDADMLLVKPIDHIALGARKGVVVSEEVRYMIGTSNGLAAQFLPPEAVPRSKPVGWYHIFHRDDLLDIAPRWLKYCGRVRTEPERYWSINGSIPHDIPTGDAYVERGKAPWISEMYGYSFGAAEAGVETIMTHGIVEYPSSVSSKSEEPYILHYGIDFNIGPDYNWNKMVYKNFDLFQCKGRFFGAPPKPRSASEKHGAFVVNTINHGICDFYRSHCSVEPECPPDEKPPAGRRADCDDNEGRCWSWALGDECDKNPGFMSKTCPRSCGLCPDQQHAEASPLAASLSPAATSGTSPSVVPSGTVNLSPAPSLSVVASPSPAAAAAEQQQLLLESPVPSPMPLVGHPRFIEGLRKHSARAFEPQGKGGAPKGSAHGGSSGGGGVAPAIAPSATRGREAELRLHVHKLEEELAEARRELMGATEARSSTEVKRRATPLGEQSQQEIYAVVITVWVLIAVMALLIISYYRQCARSRRFCMKKQKIGY